MEAVRACRRGGVSGERAARQKKARAGGREEARDRKHDEKVQTNVQEAGVGRSCECAGRREEDGRGCRPEIRVRAGGSRGVPEACGSRIVPS